MWHPHTPSSAKASWWGSVVDIHRGDFICQAIHSLGTLGSAIEPGTASAGENSWPQSVRRSRNTCPTLCGIINHSENAQQ